MPKKEIPRVRWEFIGQKDNDPFMNYIVLSAEETAALRKKIIEWGKNHTK